VWSEATQRNTLCPSELRRELPNFCTAIGALVATAIRTLSTMFIVRIFLAVPMDWIVGAFRIERLTSRHKGSIHSVHGRGADGRPRETTARGARALCQGIDEGWTIWCESAADHARWCPRLKLSRLPVDSAVRTALR